MQNLERYLEDRVAIITGGFSGIGLSIGEALALRGAAVALGGVLCEMMLPMRFDPKVSQYSADTWTYVI